MKNLLFTLFISSVTFSVTAQSKFSFGVEAFPYFTAIKTINKTDSEENALYVQSHEVGKLCFSQQFFTSYRLTSKASISIGIGYQNISSNTTEATVTYGDYIDSRRGFVYSNAYGNGGIKSSINYSHHNIQVPLLFAYKFSKKIYVRGGLNTIFNISNKHTHNYTDQSGNQKTETIESASIEYRKLNLAGRIGIGFNLLNKEKYRFYTEPVFESSFFGLSNNANINRVPLSLGVAFGIEIF